MSEYWAVGGAGNQGVQGMKVYRHERVQGMRGVHGMRECRAGQEGVQGLTFPNYVVLYGYTTQAMLKCKAKQLTSGFVAF